MISRLIFFLLISLCCAAARSVSIQVASSHLLVGETSTLSISLEGDFRGVSRHPKIQVPGFNVSPAGVQNMSFNGRRSLTLNYQLFASTAGDFTIPAMTFREGGEEFTTTPIAIKVIAADDDNIQWREVNVGRQKLRYGLAVITPERDVYELETFPVELKILLPRQSRFNQIPIEIDASGVNIQRFSGPANGSLQLDNTIYTVLSAKSVASARKAGEITIGPGKEDSFLLIRTRVTGSSRAVNAQLPLSFPKVEMKAKPLPQPVPAGFERAVGQFTLAATADFSGAEPGDPFAVTLTLSGSGNLDTIEIPRLRDASGWRLYPPNKSIGEDVRFSGSGQTRFTQLMRPTELKKNIPSFQLVYFDPVAGSYETLSSDPIPLPEALQAAASGTPGIADTDSAKVPIAEMTGVLAPLSTLSPGKVWPPRPLAYHWWWSIAPLAVLLLLYGAGWWRRRMAVARQKETFSQTFGEIADLEQADASAAEFYRRAGRVIETTPALARDDSLSDILAARDARCFAGESADSEAISKEQRSDIVSRLRTAMKSALTLVVAAFFLAPTDLAFASADAAAGLYHKGDTGAALDTLLLSDEPQTADVLYNIGTYYALLGQPGQACLFLRRALALEPDHAEARQNLAYLQEKNGSLVYTAPDNWQNELTKFPVNAYKIVATVAGWLLVFSLLALIHCPRLRTAAGITSVLAVILLICAIIALALYPQRGDFTRDIESLAVITAEKCTIYPAAATASGKIIELTPGSLITTLEDRDDWTYIETSSGLRGWALSSKLQRIVK